MQLLLIIIIIIPRRLHLYLRVNRFVFLASLFSSFFHVFFIHFHLACLCMLDAALTWSLHLLLHSMLLLYPSLLSFLLSMHPSIQTSVPSSSESSSTSSAATSSAELLLESYGKKTFLICLVSFAVALSHSQNQLEPILKKKSESKRRRSYLFVRVLIPLSSKASLKNWKVHRTLERESAAQNTNWAR